MQQPGSAGRSEDRGSGAPQRRTGEGDRNPIGAAWMIAILLGLVALSRSWKPGPDVQPLPVDVAMPTPART